MRSLTFSFLNLFLFLFFHSSAHAKTVEQPAQSGRIYYVSEPNISVPSHDKFVVITPGKCGTHLLMKTLTKMINKDWRMCWDRTINQKKFFETLMDSERKSFIQHFHLYYNKFYTAILRSMGYKVVFIIRDPRDQLISMLFYIRDKGWWGLNSIQYREPFKQLSFDEQIMELITGKKFGVSAPHFTFTEREGFLKENSQLIHTVRFEDLVGEKGGGKRSRQKAVLFNLATFLNINLSHDEILKRTSDIFGKPGEGTFRSGQIGDWKKYFSTEHVKAFKKVFGKKLIELGYEKDDNW